MQLALAKEMHQWSRTSISTSTSWEALAYVTWPEGIALYPVGSWVLLWDLPNSTILEAYEPKFSGRSTENCTQIQVHTFNSGHIPVQLQQSTDMLFSKHSASVWDCSGSRCPPLWQGRFRPRSFTYRGERNHSPLCTAIGPPPRAQSRDAKHRRREDVSELDRPSFSTMIRFARAFSAKKSFHDCYESRNRVDCFVRLCADFA